MEKLKNETQREINELLLKLANQDLKYKQNQLEENKELHSIKKKLTLVEEELTKAKKENEQLIAKQKLDEEANEKTLLNVKQKAELRMASIKV